MKIMKNCHQKTKNFQQRKQKLSAIQKWYENEHNEKFSTKDQKFSAKGTKIVSN